MKYTREQLAQMAAEFLEAHESGDARATVLMARLVARTGLPQPQCLLNIIMLA